MYSECGENVLIQQQSYSRPPPRDLGINVERPKFPQYAVCSKRLESFDTWPEHLPVTKEDLVEAGLVYTGVGDSVRCYYCGGGLRNWEEGDKPMEEHAKWYPQCPHIMLVKGRDYSDMLIRGEKSVVDSAKLTADKKLEVPVSNHLESGAAQSCIYMGYCREMVSKAIDIYIKTHGNTNFKGRDLCLILFDMEDNVDNIDHHVNEDQQIVVSNNSEENDNTESLEDLIDENNRLKEHKMCKICLDSLADVIFLPCGHMVSCPQCAPALSKCPICRKIINGHVKVFFSLLREN